MGSAAAKPMNKYELAQGKGTEQVFPYDWKDFESNNPRPRQKGPDLLYYPSQMREPTYANFYASSVNCYQHRSGLCMWPNTPCDGPRCIFGCFRDLEIQRVSQPDAWFLKMLKARLDPNCPEALRGLWWLRDNNTNELLVTLQDANWVSPRVAIASKGAAYNWTHDRNCVGSIMTVWNKIETTMAFEVSPNGKWLFLREGPLQAWAYFLQPGDKLVTPEGTPVTDVYPGDLMRTTPLDLMDVDSAEGFQYLMQRVAYLSPEGDLIKTEAYKDMLRNVCQESKVGWCGDTCLCNLTTEERVKRLSQLNDEQAVRYPPAQQSMSN